MKLVLQPRTQQSWKKYVLCWCFVVCFRGHLSQVLTTYFLINCLLLTWALGYWEMSIELFSSTYKSYFPIFQFYWGVLLVSPGPLTSYRDRTAAQLYKLSNNIPYSEVYLTQKDPS